MMGNFYWSTRIFAAFLFAATLPMATLSYKILLMPLPARSHVFSLAAIAEGLVSRGHEVTFLIGENYRLNTPEIEDRPGVTVTRYSDSTDGVQFDYDAMDENITLSGIEHRGSVAHLFAAIAKQHQDSCKYLLSGEHFGTLERVQFDVAVIDGNFFWKCQYLVPHRLQIPWITYSDAVDPLAVRVLWPPSFAPNGLLPITEKMTFVERLKNTVFSLLISFVLPSKFPPPKQEILDNYQIYGSFRSQDELVAKSAMFLLSMDILLDYPRPMMPNMVNVGGLTIKRALGQLPENIKQFIEGAKKGVVLMTFGTKASSIPAHLVEKFSDAFRRLDGYRVIWRLDNRYNVKIPDNVMIAKWLPQSDVLAHPAVKLFITHCGSNGQYEAVYHGVPMIGFPLFFDQMYNAKRIEYKGYGLHMNLYEFTSDELLDNIQKIIGDKSYKQRVTKASEIFRSQQLGPVETATFWIEHVCRFGGDHLRSAGNDLPLYSYLMLDILAVFLALIHILIYIVWKIVKYCLTKCGRRRIEIKSEKAD